VNFKEYEHLGKIAKQLYPAKYAGVSDDEAGVRAVMYRELPQEAFDSVILVPQNQGLDISRIYNELSQSDDIEQVISSFPLERLTKISPALSGMLDSIHNKDSSSGLVAWFHKLGARQRAGQYEAESSEFSALMRLSQAQTSVLTDSVQKAFLPEKLRNQVQLERGKHKLNLTTLALQLGTVFLTSELTRRAAEKGLTFEIYLQELQEEVRLGSRGKEIDQDIDKDTRLKRNAREDEDEKRRQRMQRANEAVNKRRLQENLLNDDLDKAIEKIRVLQNNTSMDVWEKEQKLIAAQKHKKSIETRLDELRRQDRQADSGEEV
jgi:hypothetical protein